MNQNTFFFLIPVSHQWLNHAKHFVVLQNGVPSPYTKSGFDTSKHCWVKTSLPVWQLCCHFWLTVMDDSFCLCLGITQDTNTNKNHLFKANTTTVIGQITVPPQLVKGFPCFHAFSKVYWVCVTSLVLIDQTLAEIIPHFLFGGFTTDFDCLYWTVSKIKNPYNNFYEPWCWRSPIANLVKTGQKLCVELGLIWGIQQ